MLRQHAGLLIRDVRVQISVEGPIWDRNLKVKYRTFNPTKKGQYLPVSPYKNTLPTNSGNHVELVVVLQASVFLYGKTQVDKDQL